MITATPLKRLKACADLQAKQYTPKVVEGCISCTSKQATRRRNGKQSWQFSFNAALQVTRLHSKSFMSRRRHVCMV